MSNEKYHKNSIFLFFCLYLLGFRYITTNPIHSLLFQLHYFQNNHHSQNMQYAFCTIGLVGHCFWSVIPRMKRAMESCVGSCCRISRLGAFKSSPITNSQISPVFVLTVSNNGSMSFLIRSWSVDGRRRRVFRGTSTTPKSSKTMSCSGKRFFEYALAIPDIVALSTYRT